MNVCTVLEHNSQKIRRCVRAVNRAFESALYKERQSAAVIDVRVAENNAFNFSRVERERFFVHSVHFLAALELSAVQKNLMVVRGYHVAGAGNSYRCSAKFYFHFLSFSSP